MSVRSVISSVVILVALMATSGVNVSPSAASGGNVIWVAQTKAGQQAYPEATTVSPDGSRVYVTGFRQKVGQSYDFFTVAYDASTGAKIRATRYNNAMHTRDKAWDIKASPDGSRVFVMGSSRSGGRGIAGYNYTVVAYDSATGAQLWVASYDGPANKDDDPTAFDVSPDGSRVFVTGGSTGVGTRTDFATVAYDAATGAQLWVARWGHLGRPPTSLGRLPSFPAYLVIVTGTSFPLGGQESSVTIAYSAATGARLWLRRSSRGEGGSGGDLLTISPDGTRAYVTGYRYGSISSPTTVAYDVRDGTEEWSARYDKGGFPVSSSVSPDDSRIYVLASDALIALDGSTGDKLWSKPIAIEVAGMAIRTDGGRVYVGENINGTMGTVAYDPISGAKQWTASYGSPGEFLDERSIAVSPDGSKVFASGYVVGDSNGAYVTVAFGTA